jgi:uncharacterized protein (DUF1015 family)
MKTKTTNIIADGKRLFEKTKGVLAKTEQIRMEISKKYEPLISGERSYLKKLFLRIKMEVEIRRKLKEISSPRNLHVFQG